MKILLTGGTGFLGSHLCPLLLKEGHHVTIVTRQPMKVFTRYDGMVRALRRLADLTIDDHFDAVINLSGEGIADQPWTHPRKLALYTSRVNFTEELVDWMCDTIDAVGGDGYLISPAYVPGSITVCGAARTDRTSSATPAM